MLGVVNMAPDHSEEKALMSGEPDNVDEEGLQLRSSKSRSKLFSVHILLIVVQLTFLVLNIRAYLSSGLHSCEIHAGDGEKSGSNAIDGPYSPALDAVEYEIRTIDTHKSGSKFIGEPRPEVDQAWSDLLSATMITLSADEMRQMNKTAGLLKSGNGYAGYLESYHQLHCVKRMYQFRHPEYYKDIEDGDKFNNLHWDHCVEVLRQGIMCHADLTINTVFSTGEHEVGVDTAWPRKCTNWNRIQEWAEARAAPVDRNNQADFIRPLTEAGSIGPEDLL